MVFGQVAMMESVTACDAEARLGELLDRVSKRESFEITRHGRPVGQLIPPTTISDRAATRAAAKRLIVLGKALPALTKEELIALKNQGRRF